MRRVVSLAMMASALIMLGCSTTRKISQVGLRNPASVPEELQSEPISALRARVQLLTQLPRECPDGIQRELPWLAQQQVKLPLCPAGFTERMQQNLNLFRLEERGFLEEVVGSQCRSLSAEDRQVMLRSLLESFRQMGTVQRTEDGSSENGRTMEELRENLSSLLLVNLPLERWVVRNGRWAIPEGDLEQLESIIVRGACRVQASQMEQGYQTLQTMEDLQSLLPDGEQKARLGKFLNGFHKLIDNKVVEFFGGER